VGTVRPNRISVYTVGPTDPPSLSGVAFQLAHNFTNPRKAPQPAPGLPLNYDQLGATPITAYWRKNVLYTAFADCIRFGDMGPGQCSDAVHIIRLAAVATLQAAPDELIFGERNPLDEPPGTVNDYAFPGLAREQAR
jgi:hypothetical protein